MRLSNIRLVRQELGRVLKALDEVQTSPNYTQAENDHVYGCPETAALRRASMDLTKALAKLRNERG